MRHWIRLGAALTAFATGTLVGVPLWTGRTGARVEHGGAPVRALARTVAERSTRDLSGVGPGDPRFDGEWRTVTCAFGALGLALVALQHHDDRAGLQEGARTCLQRLQTREARGFARVAWGVDGGAELHHPGGHAWLGYEALALAMSHRAFPDDAWIAQRHDQVHRALVRRLATLEPARLQTYPGETYPPDQAVLLAAVELGGHDTSAWRARWVRQAVDPQTGLLYQRLDPATGQPSDVARGSGTALAAWTLGLAGLPEGRSLWQAARTHLLVQGAGLAALREVPAHAPARMDVDSGPVILGLGLSASGFALGAARTQGDRPTFRHLHRLAWLVGAPAEAFGRRRWVAGGAVGDALLLAAEATPAGGLRPTEGAP